MSRCGSTLISQTLGRLPHVLSISECPAIDAAIQAGRAEDLRKVVGALSHRDGGETHLVIKLDAWHIHDLPLIRSAYPEAPWIFVSRDPKEVLESQLRSPGRLASPGAVNPHALRASLSEITLLSREEWCARVLDGICTSAREFQHDPLGMYIDYRQLPGAIWQSVAPHFALPHSA